MTTEAYNRVISWRTAKRTDGFYWEVYSFDFQTPNKVHASGIKATRERASGAAKRACRFHKAEQQKANNNG